MIYPAIPDVVATGQNYWYCWGDFHASGETPSIPDGFLASGTAELSDASCLCQQDTESRSDAAARGTIFFHGIDVDDFEAHVRTTLKGRETEDKIRSLVERRRTFVAAVEQLKYDSPDVAAPSAADLNRLYSIFFHEAERIVGGENFKLVFGVSARQETNVVDPAIYESALRPRGKR